jgi:hypothetical protein
MRGKRRIIKEMRDAEFITNAAKNGDPAAAEIYQLISQINIEKADLKNIGSGKELHKALDLLDNFIRTRDLLIYRYGLQGKKARIYLDSLKREKREERERK